MKDDPAETPESLGAETLAQLADMFRLLGDPTRLKLLLLVLEGPRPLAALAEAAGISAPLASHHLRLLKAARLVRGVRKGKQVFHEAADEHVRRMLIDMAAHAAEQHKE